MKNDSISNKDREILRELAKKQYDYSQLPIMKERERLWHHHNDLQGKRPMIRVEIDTFEHELLEGKLQCEGIVAQSIERQLYHNILNHEMISDDSVVPDYFPLRWKSTFKLFGFDITKENAKDSQGRNLGHHFNYTITDLQEAMPNLKPTKFGVDKVGTLHDKIFLEELFGDILRVKIIFDCLYAVPTQDVVHMMGMEKMLFAMYDYPDEFKQFMQRIAQDYIAYFKYLEKEGCILPTTGNQILGQGSLCYTKDLPSMKKDREVLKTTEVWGFMDSQETIGVSPEMFEEFIFPYYKQVANLYGLLSYGCCEPIHPFWEDCISKFQNLRKVSISPWCDEIFMGEKLRGSSIIYHRKPSPNFLGVGKDLDESAFSEHIIQTLKAAKGCHLEITQRDIYTLGGNITKAKRYVEMIRQLVDQYWE